MKDEFEFIIEPEINDENAAWLEKQAETLEWMLDNPYGGTKPAAETGILEQMGSLLWKCSGLDAETVLDAIEDALDDERSVRFIVTGGRFQHFPWELLYHENPEIGFLSRKTRCVVSRCVRYRKGRLKTPEKNALPFRILLFVSSPEGLDHKGRLDFEKEEELLYTALDSHLRRGEVHIEVAEDGALETLVKLLEEKRFHAVILSMHGTYAKNLENEKEWGLLFEDKSTYESAPVAGSVLADALKNLPKGHRPDLMVLAACRSAKHEQSANSISNVARILHESGFARVLGMRLSVLDAAASVFNAELFRRLALGEDLGRSVSIARAEVARGAWLGGSNGKDAGQGAVVQDPYAQWTLPVLLDRTKDGPMVDTNLPAELVERPRLPSVLIGDGTILLPERSSFIGRRREIRKHLRGFLDGTHPRVMFTGPGGVGKTALAGLFARGLMEKLPDARIMGFQAPFDLDKLFEPLRKEAFDGEEESNLKDAISKEPDEKERVR
ncbi:CHAT domain-containing protein [Desulfobacterales bacterium HSG16]|nr:CHAT domain-containing protein [Desulfobacterales bacterium HSG16]